MLHLTYTGNTTIPVEAECITPENLAGKSVAEIAALPVQVGNAPAPLGEFFRVRGDAGDQQVVLEGDCTRVKSVGASMAVGSIRIEGNIGMHVGAEMRGGEIDVQGNAAEWAGAEMRGGLLRIRGDAGDLAGAGYRGSRLGMRGGVILVHGNAGNEVGCSMRRGLIVVVGAVADFTGVSMIAGSIFLFGPAGARTGAGMKRGTIACLGRNRPQLLPTFQFDCLYQPAFLRVYFRHLRDWGLAIPEEILHAGCRRYSGDLVELGKGELLIADF